MINIEIQKVTTSRVSEIDFNNVPLGRTFTDHMFICTYADGKWGTPKIKPLELIPTHPAAMAFHYGQALFEGLKATKSHKGEPLLFRPDQNAKRLNYSARRLGMPEFPEDLFVEGLKKLVAIDQAWIPPLEGSALYLRPFMYASEAFIGMRAATDYNFIIIASPANPLYSGRVKLWAEKKYIRAADGGTGSAKAAGNYAAAVLPTELAKEKGYDQVLWLDAKEHSYIEEVGTMNIFFHIGDKFITPPLSGSILSGVTRMSVIDYLRHKGHTVEERKITLDEVKKASNDGTLKEAFGTGTAVGIAYIETIGDEDGDIHVSNESPIGEEVNDWLNQLKMGKTEDVFNWIQIAE